MTEILRGSSSVGLESLKVFVVIATGAALQLIFHVLLARLLGIESYGSYAFGFSVYTLSLLLVKLSGDTLILRELSTASDAFAASGLFLFLVVTSLALFASVLGGYFLLRGLGMVADRYAESLFSFLLVLPLGVVMRYTMAVARVRGRAVQSQFGDQVIRPMVASLTLLIMSRAVEPGVGVGILAFSVGLVAGLIATARAVFSFRGLGDVLSRMPAVRLDFPLRLKSAATITAISGQNVAIKQVDILFLGILSIPSVVGAYAAATKIAVLAVFMLSAVNMVIAPVMAKAYADNRGADLQRHLAQASRLVAGFSFAFWLIVFVAAEYLLTFFGAGFEEAGTALRIMVTAQLVNALVGPVGTLLNMTNREGVAVRVLTLSLFLCVTLNLILIPPFQEIGAAIAYSTAIITWNVLMALYAKKQLGLNTTVFQR